MNLIVSDEFIESWIEPHEEDLAKLFILLHSLDYYGAIIEDVPNTKLHEILDSLDIKNSFTAFNRKTIIKPNKNPSEMALFRNNYDFIVFHCRNAEITKWACQDQRIDCLSFPLEEIHILADDSTIKLAKEQDKAIEIDYSEIVHKKNPIGLLRNLKKVFFKAVKKNLPVILSSRAHNKYELRSICSILGVLNFLDVEEKYYKEISQKWLINRLGRNTKRKNESFVVPGVHIKDQEELQ